MPRTVVIDEIHVTIRVPDDLPDDRAEEIRQTLASGDLMIRLRQAVRAVVRTFAPLSAARVSLNR